MDFFFAPVIVASPASHVNHDVSITDLVKAHSDNV